MFLQFIIFLNVSKIIKTILKNEFYSIIIFLISLKVAKILIYNRQINNLNKRLRFKLFISQILFLEKSLML